MNRLRISIAVIQVRNDAMLQKHDPKRILIIRPSALGDTDPADRRSEASRHPEPLPRCRPKRTTPRAATLPEQPRALFARTSAPGVHTTLEGVVVTAPYDVEVEVSKQEVDGEMVDEAKDTVNKMVDRSRRLMQA